MMKLHSAENNEVERLKVCYSQLAMNQFETLLNSLTDTIDQARQNHVNTLPAAARMVPLKVKEIWSLKAWASDIADLAGRIESLMENVEEALGEPKAFPKIAAV